VSRRAAVVAASASALVATVLIAATAFADAPVPQRLSDQLANCQDMLAQAETSHEKAWAEDCVALAERAIAAVPTPSPTVGTSTGGSTTTPPSTTPPATTTPPAPTPTPTVTPPPATTWPGAANTGVPDGTTLTAYTGSCTITAPTTIVAKTIRCGQLTIRAAVVIRDSHITGTATGVSAVGVESGSLTITDSTIVAPANSSGLDGGNITATRLDISGGNRGAWCSRCTIQGSWIHGGRATGGAHASGLRAEVDSRFVHNTIVCDIAGDYCSADLTGYPDFQAVKNWTIENNYFGATTGYFCAYGGATAGKPYSSAADNATNIVFRGNVFARGPARVCGRSGGTPITDYAKSRTGNVWSGNRYDDGTAINV
jgi:hypothetical protein